MQLFTGFVVKDQPHGFQVSPLREDEVQGPDHEGNIFDLYGTLLPADLQNDPAGFVEGQVAAIKQVGFAMGDLLITEEPPSFLIDS
jgi:hypothetical protein